MCATRFVVGSNDYSVQHFRRKAVVVGVTVQLSAAVRWLIWCLWRVMANTLCFTPVEMRCHTVSTGGEVKGKLTNGVGSQYSSHYLGTWCIQH